jgi:regulatory protein
MKITKINQQVNHRDRYSIFIDGKYLFSLSETTLLNQKLFSGQLIDSQQLAALIKLSKDDKTYLNALRYLALRPRSVWELQSYLKHKQVDEVSSKEILNKLSDVGLLNDEAFARSWVENRRLLKPSSKRRLSLELRQKRIDEQIIQKVLGDDEDEEQTAISQLINKKRRQAKYRDDKLKLMQYLSRQGFDYVDIKAALADKPTDA